jgi:hypothetical protein
MAIRHDWAGGRCKTSGVLRVGCLLVPLGLLMACPDDGDDTTVTTELSGPRVWTHNEPESNVGLTALIVGELTYDEVHDCLLVVAEGDVVYPVVWPSGTVPLADEIGVRLPSGDSVTEGDVLSGGGGYLYVADDYGIPPECLPPTGEVAVFNPAEPVEVDSAGG